MDWIILIATIAVIVICAVAIFLWAAAAIISIFHPAYPYDEISDEDDQ